MFVKYLAYALIAAIVGGGAYVSYLQRRLKVAVRMLTEERTRQRSISASYGRITEQWFPLMEKYPYDSANFRFLGTPIDGVQFEEDKIVFVEFKSRKAELSTQQRRLKQMIQAGKVTWEEFHFFEEER
jgi:predicted Holliday junction resolvase-like endonuclease